MEHLIVSDLDGTLLDYRVRAYECFKFAAGFEMFSHFTFRDYVAKRLQSISNYQVYTELGQVILSREEFDKKWNMGIESQRFLEFDTLFPDSRQWLHEMAKNSCIILCTARRNTQNLNSQIELLNLAPYFEVVLTTENKKDKAYLIERFMRNRKFTNLHMIGDTKKDMIEGQKIGAKLYFIERGFTSSNEVLQIPNCRIFERLPRIDF